MKKVIYQTIIAACFLSLIFSHQKIAAQNSMRICKETYDEFTELNIRATCFRSFASGEWNNHWKFITDGAVYESGGLHIFKMQLRIRYESSIMKMYEFDSTTTFDIKLVDSSMIRLKSTLKFSRMGQIRYTQWLSYHYLGTAELCFFIDDEQWKKLAASPVKAMRINSPQLILNLPIDYWIEKPGEHLRPIDPLEFSNSLFFQNSIAAFN